MDPFNMAMQQMQQMAGIAEKHALLNKRSSALELTRIEGEIAIAEARAAAADAEIRKLQLQLQPVKGDKAATDYIKALIVATTAERDARLKEAEALNSCLETKKEIAQLALDVDPNAMNQIVGMMRNMTDDDPGLSNG